MNALRVIAMVGGLLVGVSSVSGCLKDHAPQDPFEETGTVGMQLTVPGGQSLETVSWQVLSGTTVVQSGIVDVTSSPAVNFLVGGLTPGAYTISLTGSSSDGGVTCTGSGAFTVAARQTARVTINLQCSPAPGSTGSAVVSTTFNPCAAVQSVSASTTEVYVGSSVTLSAAATAPTPGAITYQWSAPSGTFSSPTAPTTTFTNTAPGPVTVTLVVGDGPVAAGFACDPSLDSTSVTVTFDATSDGGFSAPSASLVDIVDPLAGQGGTDNVFSIGADSQVHLTFLSPGLSWSSSVVNTLVNPAAPAVAGTVLSGHIENSCGQTSQSEEVFYFGADQHVHELWRWSAQATFDGWHHTDVSSAAGAPLAAQASPLASVADPSANADVVFYIGVDGHVHELTFACTSSLWTTVDLTTAYGVPAVGGGSAFAAHLNNITPTTPSEELFYVGTNQHVYELWAWSLGASFDGWHTTDVSQTAGAPVGAQGSPLATVADPSADSDVLFYLGVDSHVIELAFVGSSSLWTTVDITGKYGVPAVGSGSAFAAHLNNATSSTPSEELFYVGTNQHVYELWAWSLGTSFDGWHTTDVSGVAGAPNASSATALATDVNVAANPAQDEAFYTDASGDIHLLAFICTAWLTEDISAGGPGLGGGGCDGGSSPITGGFDGGRLPSDASFDAPGIALDYVVPLTNPGPIGASVGTGDPQNQLLTFSVVDCATDQEEPANSVYVEPALYQLSGMAPSNCLTVDPPPYNEALGWQPFFRSVDGCIRVSFAIPVTRVSVSAQVVYSGSTAGVGLAGPVPLPFLDAWDPSGAHLDQVVETTFTGQFEWATLTNVERQPIGSIVMGPQPTNASNYADNVIFQSLSYRY